MKNKKSAVGAVVFFLVLLIGVTGCRRKRNNPASPPGAEQPAAEATGTPAATPAPPAAPGASERASAPASHPGEALDPAGLKVAMDQFQRKMQRPPNDWQEMIDARVITAVPKRKDGQPLDFSEYIEFSVHRAGKAGRP